MCGPHVRLEPEDLLGDDYAPPGQLKSAIDLLDEVLLVEPLRVAVARRPRDTESFFDRSAIERFSQKRFQNRAVPDDIAE